MAVILAPTYFYAEVTLNGVSADLYDAAATLTDESAYHLMIEKSWNKLFKDSYYISPTLDRVDELQTGNDHPLRFGHCNASGNTDISHELDLVADVIGLPEVEGDLSSGHGLEGDINALIDFYFSEPATALDTAVGSDRNLDRDVYGDAPIDLQLTCNGTPRHIQLGTTGGNSIPWSDLTANLTGPATKINIEAMINDLGTRQHKLKSWGAQNDGTYIVKPFTSDVVDQAGANNALHLHVVYEITISLADGDDDHTATGEGGLGITPLFQSKAFKLMGVGGTLVDGSPGVMRLLVDWM